MDRRPDPGESRVDVREYDDRIEVIADIPGRENPEDFDLYCDGRTLYLRVGTERQSTAERVRLPARVDEASATATYNNGVLAVTFTRDDRTLS